MHIDSSTRQACVVMEPHEYRAWGRRCRSRLEELHRSLHEAARISSFAATTVAHHLAGRDEPRMSVPLFVGICVGSGLDPHPTAQAMGCELQEGEVRAATQLIELRRPRYYPDATDTQRVAPDAPDAPRPWTPDPLLMGRTVTVEEIEQYTITDSYRVCLVKDLISAGLSPQEVGQALKGMET